MSEPYDGQSLEARVVALEEWIMHTDHLLKNLNEVVCQMQNRIDEHSRLIAKIKDVARRANGNDIEERSLDDERPPHY